jgi:hypothetical protein
VITAGGERPRSKSDGEICKVGGGSVELLKNLSHGRRGETGTSLMAVTNAPIYLQRTEQGELDKVLALVLSRMAEI